MPRNPPSHHRPVDADNPEWTREDFDRAVKTGGVPLDEAVKALRKAKRKALG